MTNKANEQVTMAQIKEKNDMVKENMTKEKIMKNVNERKAVWSKMFPNIAGYDKIREEGAQIVDMIENKEEYLKVGARCPRGWFFYGEPGMGKTQLVLDIASYVHYPIIEISYSDAINKKLEIN